MQFRKKTTLRWLVRYLIVCGIGAHILILGVYLHYRSTGASPYYYAQKVVSRLEQERSNIAKILARGTRLGLLNSGLIVDPAKAYPHIVNISLPPWRGEGANVLRGVAAPRYTTKGKPIATAEHSLWTVAPVPKTRSIRVNSVEELNDAIARAKPGLEIVLAPGLYRLDRPLVLDTQGTPEQPLVFRGESIGDVVLELVDNAWLQPNAGYWTISDMIVRGRCSSGACPRFAYVSPKADAFTLRNVFVSGVATLVESTDERPTSIAGLLDGVTLVGGKPTSLSIRWPLSAMRQITIPASRAAYRVLCPKHQIDTDCDTDSLSEAFKTAPPGGLLLLRTGTYRQAATVNTANLHLVAEPGAHLRGASVEGKGAIVVNKDVTIEGLECSHIRVNDGNGCCIRQQHGDVTLIGVHFHHSQMGILTGHNGGRIKIVDSYLHDSGFDESGQLGHNIYVNSGFLEFIRSWSLAAQNAGHEIKSRAAETIIEDSLIASLNSRDSRLIDTPNGGILEVRNSVLGKGPRSENWELIGFGLELKDGRSKYGTNTVLIENNTIYLDRPDGTKLLNAAHADIIQVQQNIIIGDSEDRAGNEIFPSREDARVRPYPNLDPLHF